MSENYDIDEEDFDDEDELTGEDRMIIAALLGSMLDLPEEEQQKVLDKIEQELQAEDDEDEPQCSDQA